MSEAAHTPFELPATLHNEAGKVRTVGVEFEFAGLDVDRTCEVIRGLWGGEVERENRFYAKVRGTEHGDFTVCADAKVLQKKSYLEFLRDGGLLAEFPQLEESLDEAAAAVGSVLVPSEVSCPPVPMTELHEIERLREELRRRQALGTGASVVYGFGLHLNPECPSLQVDTVLRYLRSYLLMESWLRDQAQVDFTRLVLPYIDRFPGEYVSLVVDPEYRPDAERFITDYIEHNPTRNRPLDMLPLLSAMDEKLARSLLPPDERVKRRPTFHFRLPNCEIDVEGWSIAQEWGLWLAVERLAEHPDEIARLGRGLLDLTFPALGRWSKPWKMTIEEWLEGHRR